MEKFPGIYTMYQGILELQLLCPTCAFPQGSGTVSLVGALEIEGFKAENLFNLVGFNH